MSLVAALRVITPWRSRKVNQALIAWVLRLRVLGLYPRRSISAW